MGLFDLGWSSSDGGVREPPVAPASPLGGGARSFSSASMVEVAESSAGGGDPNAGVPDRVPAGKNEANYVSRVRLDANAWCHNVLYCTILYYILYYTILYYTILYYTILYYTILYYTILY